jgi:hypothetical protein
MVCDDAAARRLGVRMTAEAKYALVLVKDDEQLTAVATHRSDF